MKRIEPKAGQESVWDYPRPPRLELMKKHLKIVFNGEIIAETNRARTHLSNCGWADILL